MAATMSSAGLRLSWTERRSVAVSAICTLWSCHPCCQLLHSEYQFTAAWDKRTWRRLLSEGANRRPWPRAPSSHLFSKKGINWV